MILSPILGITISTSAICVVIRFFVDRFSIPGISIDQSKSHKEQVHSILSAGFTGPGKSVVSCVLILVSFNFANKVKEFSLFLNRSVQSLAHQVQYGHGGVLDIQQPVFVEVE